MAFIEVDPTKLKFDAAPPPQGGFVEVDPSQLQMDAPQPQGFLGNTADALSTRWSQARQDVRNYPEMAPVIGLGAAAGSANDVIGQGMSAITPDVVKQGLATGAKATAEAIDSTQPGQAFGDALLGASDKLKAFMQANPRTAIGLNTAGNVASLVPVGKGAGAAAKGAQEASTGLKSLAEGYDAKYAAGKAPFDPIQPKGMLNPELLGAGAKMKYAEGEAQGALVKPAGFRSTVKDLELKAGYQTREGREFAGDNPVTQTLAKLRNMANRPIGLQGLDEVVEKIDSDISIATRQGDKKVAGKLTEIKYGLKNMSETVKPDDLVNPQAFQAWRDGDTLFSAKLKMQRLNDIAEDADYTQNPDTSMRLGMKNLAKQLRKNPQGYTKEEIKALKQGGKFGLGAEALKFVGGRVPSALIGGALGATGGPIGAALGIVAGEAAGMPLRWAGTALQEAKLRKPYNMIANRPAVQKALPAQLEEIARLPMSEQKQAIDELLKTRPAKAAPLQSERMATEPVPPMKPLDTYTAPRTTSDFPINAPPPSRKIELLTRIRQLGGIGDKADELAAVNAKNISKKGAVALDYMRERLVQEGYGDFATEADLLQAIDDSTRGARQYTDPATGLKRALTQQQVTLNDPAYIENYAHSLGIDTTGKTMQQLKALIAAKEEEIPF